MTDFNRKKNRKLIIMVSGRGNNMSAIINTCKSKKWPIEVVAVISDCECKAREFRAHTPCKHMKRLHEKLTHLSI